MKRALILGLSLAIGSAASAQSPTPVSVYPGTTVRLPAGPRGMPTTVLAPAEVPSSPMPPAQAAAPLRSDPLQPLGGLLAMPLPTAPTVPAGSCASGSCGQPCPPACGTPLFATASRDACGKSRPCLDRVIAWLTWHPGPSVLPVLTPTPAHTPLQGYFACTPLKNPGYPTTAKCASPAATTGKLASAFGLGGVTTRCAGKACQATPVVAPVVIPLPSTCADVSACHSGRCAFDRLLGLFSCGTCR